MLNVTGGKPPESGTLDVDALLAETGAGMLPYSHTKRAMEAASLAQASDFAEANIVIVFPGMASTSMTQGISFAHFPWWMKPFYPIFKLMTGRDDGGASAAKAARSVIWAATADLAAGTYVAAADKVGSLHGSVKDEANQKRMVAFIRDKMGASA